MHIFYYGHAAGEYFKVGDTQAFPTDLSFFSTLHKSFRRTRIPLARAILGYGHAP